MPTDIDALIEYRAKGYVLVEAKFKGVPLQTGQILALERMSDDFIKAHKKALCVIARHTVVDTEQPVFLATATVERYRWQRHWFDAIGRNEVTVKELVDRFINWLEVQA